MKSLSTEDGAEIVGAVGFLIVWALIGWGIYSIYSWGRTQIQSYEKQSERSDKFFSGCHKLLKMKGKDYLAQTSCGGGGGVMVFPFAVGGGGSCSSTSYEVEILFHWQTQNGEYFPARLPRNRLSVQVDETIKTPEITIIPDGTCFYLDDPARVNGHISKAIILCNSRDLDGIMNVLTP